MGQRRNVCYFWSILCTYWTCLVGLVGVVLFTVPGFPRSLQTGSCHHKLSFSPFRSLCFYPSCLRTLIGIQSWIQVLREHPLLVSCHKRKTLETVASSLPGVMTDARFLGTWEIQGLRMVEVRLGYIIRLWIEGGGAETQRDYSVGKVLSVQAWAPEFRPPALIGKLGRGNSLHEQAHWSAGPASQVWSQWEILSQKLRWKVIQDNTRYTHVRAHTHIFKKIKEKQIEKRRNIFPLPI